MDNQHNINISFRLKTSGIMLALSAIMALALAGCRLPGSLAPTPFVFTTPDKTLTAIFAPLLTLTPEPPQVFTATPDAIQPSPFPSPTPSFTAEMPATPTQTHTRPAPTLRPGALVEASYLENPPLLDGIFDEWNLTAYPVRNVVYGALQWQGEADASATVMVGWDQTYLYLAVQVRDDRYVQEASGANIFKGDSLEILIDSDLAGDFAGQSLNADDYQLGISPGSPYPGQDLRAYLWFPSSRQGGRADVSIAARAREGGYNVETAIPWSLFGINPQDGDAFGFAISVSDNDLEGEQVQQSMVSNVSTRSLTNPTSWGSLLLLKP
jgi:hypothetical protein